MGDGQGCVSFIVMLCFDCAFIINGSESKWVVCTICPRSMGIGIEFDCGDGRLDRKSVRICAHEPDNYTTGELCGH